MKRALAVIALVLAGGCAANVPTGILLELDAEDPALRAEGRSMEILVRSGADLEITEREVLDDVTLPLQVLLVPANRVAEGRLVEVDLALYDGPDATGYEIARRSVPLRYESTELTRLLVVFEP